MTRPTDARMLAAIRDEAVAFRGRVDWVNSYRLWLSETVWRPLTRAERAAVVRLLDARQVECVKAVGMAWRGLVCEVPEYRRPPRA